MPNHNGYTWQIDLAGRYSQEEADKICASLISRGERYFLESDVLEGRTGQIETDWRYWDKEKPLKVVIIPAKEMKQSLKAWKREIKDV